MYFKINNNIYKLLHINNYMKTKLIATIKIKYKGQLPSQKKHIQDSIENALLAKGFEILTSKNNTMYITETK